MDSKLIPDPNYDTVLVIDNGSYRTRAGFIPVDSQIPETATPRVVLPTCIGRPRSRPMEGMGVKAFYVGADAVSKRGILISRWGWDPKFDLVDQEIFW